MIEPVENRVRTEMDAMDSIDLSTCDACCTIQLLCQMISSPHFPLQLPAYEPSSLLNQEYMSDQASGCIVSSSGVSSGGGAPYTLSMG